ncbi:cullin-1-like, partial [Trifolium medium]|nr:cullin-1-like [Trifolium medium]
MSNSEQKIITFEEGWDFMHKVIQKLLQDLPDPHFTSPDHYPQLVT